MPSEQSARLDSHNALLRRYLKAVEDCLKAECPLLTPPTELVKRKPERRSLFASSDLCAELALHLYPQNSARALELAVALARLSEESPRLLSRRSLPLGRGFEDLYEERVRRRFEKYQERAGLRAILEEHGQVFLEEPGRAYEIFEEERGPLTDSEKGWLELERRAGLLNFVRRDKTDGQGHIRWYLRPDKQWTYVLERLGVEGYWSIPCPDQIPAGAQLVSAYERCFGANDPQGWQRLEVSGALPVGEMGELKSWLRDHTDSYRCVPLNLNNDRAQEKVSEKEQINKVKELGQGFELRQGEDSWGLYGQGKEPITTLSMDPSENELIEFFERLDALDDLGSTSFSEGRGEAILGQSLDLALRILRERPRGKTRVRMIYVPSEIPHQLGGVPEVGAQFLKDRLEQGAREVLGMKVYRRDFERRLPELLGADVIGVGVYIHNRDDVAELCRLLRERGFVGRIILGGPETRSIDRVQQEISGWDGIIRGEADEVLGALLDVFDLFEEGKRSEALTLLGTLKGCSLCFEGELFLCHTAARNRSAEVICPLPFDWQRTRPDRVKMNFTRGCPYLCTFCPNHQGRRFRAGESDELWRYSVLAVADRLALPKSVEERIARGITRALGQEHPLPLRPALYLMELAWDRCDWGARLRGLFGDLIDPRLYSDDGALFKGLLGLDWSVFEVGPVTSRRALRALWLSFKARLLASRQLYRRDASESSVLRSLEDVKAPRWTIETSEDNTLVNRRVIREYLAKRLEYGFSGDFLFNPGQNTIRDLMNSHGGADEEFIALLVKDNPFSVAFGADGTSNAVLRQNRKPGYGVEALVAVNKALGRYEVEAANNYILLTPETTFLEALESFALWLVLPVPWRDYGNSINLRVIKEDTTLTNDEGLIFDPEDEGWDGPFRDPELRAFVEKWELSSLLNKETFLNRLRSIFLEDKGSQGLLELLVERWQENPEKDGEIRALSGLISLGRSEGQSVGEALFDLRSRVYREALVDGRCRASLSDLLASTLKGPSSGAKTSV